MPFFVKNNKIFLLSPKTQMVKLLLKTTFLQNGLCIQDWIDKVYVNLEPIVHFNFQDIDEALHHIKVNHSNYLINKDCIQVLLKQKERETKIRLPALGVTMDLPNFQHQQIPNLKKIFLSEKNDYMYYLTLSNPVSQIPEIASCWKECQKNLYLRRHRTITDNPNCL